MVSAVSSSATTTSATNSNSVTSSADANAQQDRFLKLLVAQLNNQDPMNPMDNAQMTSQMAQINTVSGIQQLNDTMKGLASQFTSMQMLQGSSVVGRDILTASNTLGISNGVARGAVDLSANADKVTVQITTPGGTVLGTVDMGALGAGRHDFSWDASNYHGAAQPIFTVKATQSGANVPTTSLVHDTVVGVGSQNGTMTVNLAKHASISYSDIVSIQ